MNGFVGVNCVNLLEIRDSYDIECGRGASKGSTDDVLLRPMKDMVYIKSDPNAYITFNFKEKVFVQQTSIWFAFGYDYTYNIEYSLDGTNFQPFAMRETRKEFRFDSFPVGLQLKSIRFRGSNAQNKYGIHFQHIRLFGWVVSAFKQNLEDLKEMKKLIQFQASTIVDLKTEIFTLQGQTKSVIGSVKQLSTTLESQVAELQGAVVECRDQIENGKKRFLDHYDQHHTVKFDLSSIKSSSFSIQKMEGNNFSCFEGAKGELEMDFVVVSGDRQKSGVIQFEGLSMELNGQPLKEFHCNPKSIEIFDVEFPKRGKYELKIEFKNFKKKFTIIASSVSLDPEKCEISLLRKEDKEKSQEFRVSDEIEVMVQFKNEEGLGIPFKYLEEHSLALHVHPLGSKKAIKQMFVSLKEENYEGEGIILAASFDLKDVSSGNYVTSLFERDFAIQKEFKVI